MKEIANALNCELPSEDYNISLPISAEEGGMIRTNDGDLFQVYIYENNAAAIDASWSLAGSLVEVQLMTSPEVRIKKKDSPNFYGFYEFGLVVDRIGLAPRPTIDKLFENQLLETTKSMEKSEFSRILRSDLKLRNSWISALENCTFNHHMAENYDSISDLHRECDNAGLKVGEYCAVAPGIAPPECQSVLVCLVGDYEEQFLIYRFNSAEIAARYGHVQTLRKIHLFCILRATTQG